MKSARSDSWSADAVRELIAMVSSKRYRDKFNDPCKINSQVWVLIAMDLLKKGHRIANTVKYAAIKCYQKWRSLEENYWKCLMKMRENREKNGGRIISPRYIIDMHKILKTSKKYSNMYSKPQTVNMSNQNHQQDNLNIVNNTDRSDHSYSANRLGEGSSQLAIIPPTARTKRLGGGSGSLSLPQPDRMKCVNAILSVSQNMHSTMTKMIEDQNKYMDMVMNSSNQFSIMVTKYLEQELAKKKDQLTANRPT